MVFGRALRPALSIAALLLLTGCINTTSGEPISLDSRSGSFFVTRQANDSRGLEKDIANQLRSRGIDASYGEAGAAPAGATHVISYIDRWQWDMRMYLIELRIEARSREGAILVGYGESKQTSLAAMGKSHIDIINRALNELLSE